MSKKKTKEQEPLQLIIVNENNFAWNGTHWSNMTCEVYSSWQAAQDELTYVRKRAAKPPNETLHIIHKHVWDDDLTEEVAAPPPKDKQSKPPGKGNAYKGWGKRLTCQEAREQKAGYVIRDTGKFVWDEHTQKFESELPTVYVCRAEAQHEVDTSILYKVHSFKPFEVIGFAKYDKEKVKVEYAGQDSVYKAKPPKRLGPLPDNLYAEVIRE